MPKALCATLLGLFAVMPLSAAEQTLALPRVGDSSLRILTPNLLELTFINTKAAEAVAPSTWNFVDGQGRFQAPAVSQFAVLVDGVPVPVQSVLGFKRRPVFAPPGRRDLRIQNSLYLRLGRPAADHQLVVVKNPSRRLWPASAQFVARADPLRHSPAIHVNQEGYAPALPKKAMVGYYLGSAGELAIPAAEGFKLVDQHGEEVFSGPLVQRPDVGYTQPGMYRVVPNAAPRRAFANISLKVLHCTFKRRRPLEFPHQRHRAFRQERLVPKAQPLREGVFAQRRTCVGRVRDVPGDG